MRQIGNAITLALTFVLEINLVVLKVSEQIDISWIIVLIPVPLIIYKVISVLKFRNYNEKI